MKISLQEVGKRFNREWIFRHLCYQFETPGKYAIIGPNGSGKSTLLQIIAGAVMHTEGNVLYHHQGATTDSPYRFLSFAAPYLELPEEMTAIELIHFHAAFKQPVLPFIDLLNAVSLGDAAHKQIRYFSSGMKQRLKLALAFFSNTPVLLLDEPLTNLDNEGVALYNQLIENYTSQKLVIISSNDEKEYRFCNNVLRITDFK